MEDSRTPNQADLDVNSLVQRAITEYMKQDSGRREPALKAELQEERRRREALEKRLNSMAEENRKSRELAELAERSSKIRSELQALGVTKVDLAYKAVQDEIHRTDDGRLVARSDNGEVGVREFLTGFVNDNPEFLPARIPGGSGVVTAARLHPQNSPVSMETISPSMSKEDKDRVRQEILRVTTQTPR